MLNRKAYIGITSNPDRRFKEHRSKWVKTSILNKAIHKYGEANFKFEVICKGTREYILSLEGKAIDVYGTSVEDHGYNLKTGEQQAYLLPEYSKKKISTSLKAYYSENLHPQTGKFRNPDLEGVPVYIQGFWFPTKEVAKTSLGISNYTFQKWFQVEIGQKPFKIYNTTVKFKPCYIGGFWFPDRLVASSALGSTLRDVNRKMKLGRVEQCSVRRGNSKAVFLKGFWFPSIAIAAEVMNLSPQALGARLRRKSQTLN